jgi:hypothetical protein
MSTRSDTGFQWDDIVYVHGLQGRVELNNHAARVCKTAPRKDGRVGVEMMIDAKRVWIKPANITLVPNAAALANPPFTNMPKADLDDVGMFFFANEGSTRIPGFPGCLMSTDVGR